MTSIRRAWPLLPAVMLCLVGPNAAAIEAAAVERVAPDQIVVRWTSDHPVDVFLATRPDAPIAKARLAAHADKDGVYQAEWTAPARPYVVLRDDTPARSCASPNACSRSIAGRTSATWRLSGRRRQARALGPDLSHRGDADAG